MCFYYTINKKNPKTLIQNNIITEEQLALFEEKHFTSGFEFPPMPVITADEPEKIQLFRWGLIPFWIKNREDAMKHRQFTLNAKAETLFQKPSFRTSALNKRCLILCSGFFEWQEVNGKKYPYYISMTDESMFVFGGIYDLWTDKITGEIISSYSIITTPSNDLTGYIHNKKKRMPFVLELPSVVRWMDKSLKIRDVNQLLQVFPSENMKAHPVKKFLPSHTDILNVPETILSYYYPELEDYKITNPYTGKGILK